MVTVRTLSEAAYRAVKCFSLRNLCWGKKVPIAEWWRQAFLVSHVVSGFVASAHMENLILALEEVTKDKSPGVLWHFPSSSFRGQHLALDINSPGSFEGRKCCMLITQWTTNCCYTLNELWVVQGIFFRPWLIFLLAPLGLSNFVFSNTNIFPCWRFRWGTVLQCSSSIVFSSAVNQQLQDVGNCGRDFW